jgi:hypothetical protein
MGVQLLRSLAHPGLKLAGDAHEHLPGLVEIGMLAGQRDRGLARMLGASADRGHQPRPAGDGLEPGFGVGQAHEQTPPVVDQRHRARRQLAAMQVVRGEAAPAPLVLELVEGVLRVGPVAVELAEREDFVVQVGDQHGVLVAGDALAALAVGLDEAQQLLTVVLAGRRASRPAGAAQHDHTTLVLPAGECQRAVDPFPALTGIGPARDPEQTLDVALDVLRQAQLEQVGLRARFELAHDAVRPEAAIAAHHLRFVIGGQFIEDLEQPGRCDCPSARCPP